MTDLAWSPVPKGWRDAYRDELDARVTRETRERLDRQYAEERAAEQKESQK